MSGNVQSCFLLSVFEEVCEYLCLGSGELNAPLVHPPLNVYSPDYALKTSVMQQNNRAKQQNCFFVFVFVFFLVWKLLLRWRRNNVFTGGGNCTSIYSKQEAL